MSVNISVSEMKETNKEKNVKKGVSRSFLLLLACFNTIVTSGTIFGWASFQRILLDRGVYIEKCPQEQSNTKVFSEITCTERLDAIGWIFTLGNFAAFANSLPTGIFMDWAGVRATGSIMTLGFLLGQILIMLYPLYDETFIILGYFLLGFAGPSINMSNLLVSELFPKKKGTILAVITSFYDIACYMFVIFYALYFNGVSWNVLWFIWIGVIICVLLNVLIFYPKRWQDAAAAMSKEEIQKVDSNTFNHNISTVDTETMNVVPEQIPVSSISCDGEGDEDTNYLMTSEHSTIKMTLSHLEGRPSDPFPKSSNDTPHADGIHTDKGTDHDPRLLQQVLSLRWSFRCFFVATSLLFSSFCILSLRDQLKFAQFGNRSTSGELSVEDRELLDDQVNIFSYVLPLGFLSLPWLGYILDYQQPWVGYIWVHILNGVVALCFLFLQNPIIRVIGYYCIAMSPQATYSASSNGLSRSYGPHHFGTHFGLLNIFVACVGLLMQQIYNYALISLDGDFTSINIIFIILNCILPFYHCCVQQEPATIVPERKELVSVKASVPGDIVKNSDRSQKAT